MHSASSQSLRVHFSHRYIISLLEPNIRFLKFVTSKMNGFGRMLLLAVVAVAYVMPHVTLAYAETDNLEELLEDLGKHLDIDALRSVVPRGLQQMFMEMTEAGQDLTKRDGGTQLPFLSELINTFMGTSYTGIPAPIISKEMVKAFLTTLLNIGLDEKVVERFKPLIDPIVNLVYALLEVFLKKPSEATTAAPTATAAAVTVK